VPTSAGRMPHRRLRGRRSGRLRERGTITIEFALVFPTLVMLLFGMIDFGRFMGARVMLSQATIAATRAACLSSTSSAAALDQAVRDSAPILNGISVQSYACTGACAGFPAAQNDQYTVTVAYTFRAGYFTSLSKTLTQTSRMVCE
jgi:Flp pilus assembly protein TadG